MNAKDMFNDLPASEQEELARLVETASSLQPGDQFIKRTEMQLKDAFTAKKEKTMKRFTVFWQVLAGTAAIVALALGTIWLVRIVAQEPHNPSVPVGLPTATLFESTSTPEATPVPTTTTQACDKVSYNVQANDTLASIAKSYSISVDELKSYNGLNTDMVFTGQSLIIPLCKQYNWHGTTVLRTVDFPQPPAEMKIYTHSASAPATIESARKLAERFGIQGDMFQDPNGPGSPSYLVTDGKQRIFVSSAGQFNYYSDFSQEINEVPVALETATSAIETFLKGHGFDFDYQLLPANGIGAGWFYVLPLTIEGKPVRFDFGLAQRLEVRISPDGQIIRLDAHLLSPDPQPVGKFGLISAEAAWQKFLSDAPFGVLQSSHSDSSERSFWYRVYPENQPVTVYGSITSFASVETGRPPLVDVNDFTATGNIIGMEKLADNTFVQAQGQFFSENGARKFRVDTWQTFDQSKMLYLDGSLRSEGGKIIFSSQGTDYNLEDVPADVPIPLENVSISGVAKEAQLDWESILYFKSPNQGGGGGCGGSFAKLNLSGILVPWPTSTPVVAQSELPTGQRIEGKRGNLSINLYEQKDGSKRTEYNFFSPDAEYILQGQGLDQLNNNHNRPVTIWGTVTGYNQYQIPIVTVERFEIPYPDLKFQILRGTQKLITIDGQQVTLFTSEAGKSYVQLMPAGRPDNSLIGVQGDLVEDEVLIIPDETFGGYPAMRVFSGGMATSPKTGQPEEMKITADQPYVMPEPVSSSGPTPILTIDSIELVYYTPNPQYASGFPDAMSPYLQPVWRFSGHYGDGSETEILIQALKPDFLLPEAAPAIQCG